MNALARIEIYTNSIKVGVIINKLEIIYLNVLRWVKSKLIKCTKGYINKNKKKSTLECANCFFFYLNIHFSTVDEGLLLVVEVLAAIKRTLLIFLA